MNIVDFSSESLVSNIEKLLADPTYKRNAQLSSDILRDRRAGVGVCWVGAEVSVAVDTGGVAAVARNASSCVSRAAAWAR